MALHADLMMVAVPNIFTRNQLEVRFRTDIEGTLAEFFGRNVHLAVLVDDSLETGDGSTGTSRRPSPTPTWRPTRSNRRWPDDHPGRAGTARWPRRTRTTKG